jgi:serine/threonine-protein kinase
VQTTADSLVGRTLEGRYRLLDRIARGGMSTVYAAVDGRLDRLVAVKVMSEALSADPAFSDRFAREARAAARLTHVNVVSVYDQGHEFGPDGHHVFLVMELVQGRTLRELLRERGRLTVPEAVSLMEPVLSALASAHRAGLVHRDVKPENILLSDQGVVKVADFGLARAVESDPSSTRTGLMMGTVAYCPPEQLTRGVCDPRSDVYSAGIVFFELLTGSTPYYGDTAMNVAYQHVHSRVPAPSSRVRNIPDEVDELVVAATDRDSTGRPSDAGAFLAEIADLRAELQLPVTPVPRRPAQPRISPPPPGASSRHDTDQATAAVPGQRTTTLLGSRGGRSDTGRLEHPTVQEHPSGQLAPPVVIPARAPGRPPNLRRRRRRRVIIALVLVILLGLGAFFGAQALIRWRFAHVPNVFGLSRQQAVASLRDAGYQVKVQPGPKYSNSVAAGKVVQSLPHGGGQLPRGHTVMLTLSAGPHLYAVPSVRNKSFGAARRALRAVGPLTVSTAPEQRYSADVAAGQVIGTRPSAGAQVRSSVPITILVSKGPPWRTVPNVSGLRFVRARRVLRSDGFQVSRFGEYNDKVAAGRVITSDPSTRARLGGTIELSVSRGPHMVAIPDITLGTPISQAEDDLRAVGLVPSVRQVAAGGASTYALYTEPHAGQQVPVGSTVSIVAYSL